MQSAAPRPNLLQKLKRLFLKRFASKRPLPYPVIDFAGYACVDPP